jgi:uncharacterized membrane protein
MTPADLPPLDLIVLSFATRAGAEDAMLSLYGQQEAGGFQLHDMVLLEKQPDGSVRVTETVDDTAAMGAKKGALAGAAFGTLVGGFLGAAIGGAVVAGVGALVATLSDIGIPGATLKKLEATVVPGTTALALLVASSSAPGFGSALAATGGREVTRTPLPEATRTTLQALSSRVRRT